MQSKKWLGPVPKMYDDDDMTSIATESINLLESNLIIDVEGEQLFNDLETLQNIKSIAVEQVSDSYLDYAGMLYAVNDIKQRWNLSTSVGLESSETPREMFLSEVDIAMESLLSTIASWFAGKLSSVWKSFKNMFKVSEQVRTWLEKNADTYNEHAAGQAFELKWKAYYTYLFINSRLDVSGHIKVSERERELTQVSNNFYAMIDPSKGYSLDAFKWNDVDQSIDRIGLSINADNAIQLAMPMIIKKDSRVLVSALPGSVYIATAITPTGMRKTGWAAIHVEDKQNITLTPNESKNIIASLHKLVDVTSAISFKYNKEQPPVKKAKDALDQFEKDGKGDSRQLKQNIKNMIALESAISASLVRTLLGLHMVAKQSLKQVK